MKSVPNFDKRRPIYTCLGAARIELEWEYETSVKGLPGLVEEMIERLHEFGSFYVILLLTDLSGEVCPLIIGI